MPDIEMFGLLAKEFHVSINDLLAGEKIPDEDFRQKADENIIAVAASSAFSFDERKTYFKKKWRKEHISLFVIIGLILIAALIIPIVIYFLSNHYVLSIYFSVCLFIHTNTPTQMTIDTIDPAGDAHPIGNNVSGKCVAA